MSGIQDHLRGHVLGSAAKCIRPLSALESLGESKVDQFDITLRVQQQVLGFQIAVGNASTVQVVEGFHNASRVEAGR